MIHALLFLSLFGKPVAPMDTVKNMNYVQIAPVTWIRNQPQVQRLYVYTAFNDYTTTATVAYQLCVNPAPDTWAYIVASGTYQITGEDYVIFSASGIDYLFTYLADSSRLNLDIE